MNFPFIHPSDSALYDFADGTASAPHQNRVAEHLESCQDCRDRVAFRRELSAATRMLPSIEPPPGLLQRILADRSAGERAILPAAARTRSSATSRVIRLGAVAAALIVIATVTILERRSRTAPTLVAATIFFPEVASAGEPTGSRVALPPVGPQIDGTRLPVGAVEYRRYLIDSSGRRTITGNGVTSVRRVNANGATAFRVERVWLDNGNATEKASKEIDSMLLDARDLHFIERYIDTQPYGRYSRITVVQKFNGDSVYGRMNSEGGDSRGVGRTFVRRLPRASAPYVSDALAPLIFTTLPMRLGWHGRVSVLGWAVRDTDVLYPVDIKVVGRNRVTVPAGSFDCWHVAITSGTHAHDVWARTSDGLVVRVRNVMQTPAPHTVEIVLLNVTS
jgi:hypothetical protein